MCKNFNLSEDSSNFLHRILFADYLNSTVLLLAKENTGLSRVLGYSLNTYVILIVQSLFVDAFDLITSYEAYHLESYINFI